nr:MAG TPA: hypothetical protein [Caudoviricetes sp.]
MAFHRPGFPREKSRATSPECAAHAAGRVSRASLCIFRPR